MLARWVSVRKCVCVPAFSSSSEESAIESGEERRRRRRREAPFNCFTPAEPVYAFLANLYSGLADVGRRSLRTVLSPAFLRLSALPLRTCSLAFVCLCAWQPGRLRWHGMAWHGPGKRGRVDRMLSQVDCCTVEVAVCEDAYPWGQL